MAPIKTVHCWPGQQFGHLTVIEETRKTSPGRSSGRRAARCRCACGSIVEALLSNLTSGQIVSCGCRRKRFGRDLAKSPARLARLRERSVTHGSAGHPLYGTYRNMVARCHNPDRKDFRNYGGRGITVCDEWLGSPATFIAWIETNLGPRPNRMTLDRIDNNGNYEPGNVRWATGSMQLKNRGR